MIAGFHLTYFTLYCATNDDLDDTGCARSKRYLYEESKEGLCWTLNVGRVVRACFKNSTQFIMGFWVSAYFT